MPNLSAQLKRRDLCSATITPVVRIDNLPCTLYNQVCQANVILTKRLIPGRLHDFAVRVRDTKGDSNSMQATISATNATTSRDKIFPHIPSLIMVPEVIIDETRLAGSPTRLIGVPRLLGCARVCFTISITNHRPNTSVSTTYPLLHRAYPKLMPSRV